MYIRVGGYPIQNLRIIKIFLTCHISYLYLYDLHIFTMSLRYFPRQVMHTNAVKVASQIHGKTANEGALYFHSQI